jgi:cytochrome c-type biogenesis protein CcmE
MTPKAKKQLTAVAAIGVAVAALTFVAFGNIGENLVYYWSPEELLSKGEAAAGPTIRLGGVVRPGSVQWDADRNLLEFDCQQDHLPQSPFVKVVSEGVPPQMFRDGIGIVVEGTWSTSGQVFSSSRLMVNHSNEYRKEGHPDVEAVEPIGTTAQR